MFRIFLLIAVLALAVSPALADGVDFNFGVVLGDLGASRTFTDGSFTVGVAGFNGVLADHLFAKNEGPTEFGLGIIDGTDREISDNHWVQLNLTPIIARNPTTLSISLNSIQGPDFYNIWGSNTAGVLGTLLASNQTAANFNLLPFAGQFNYFSITAPGESVLIDDLDVSTVSTTEPGTLVLLVAGLFGIAYFGKKFALSHKSIVSESR